MIRVSDLVDVFPRHEIYKMKYDELIHSYKQCWVPPEYRLFPPLDEQPDDL
jgi:hypothetical protein